jgi:hypothetical protein
MGALELVGKGWDVQVLLGLGLKEGRTLKPAPSLGDPLSKKTFNLLSVSVIPLPW